MRISMIICFNNKNKFIKNANFVKYYIHKIHLINIFVNKSSELIKDLLIIVDYVYKII